MTSALKIKAWIEAARPRTLPLAIASIAMGGFLASFSGSFDWVVFILTIGTTISLQILSNLANDYGDSIHGADHHQRVGPARMVQSGKISINSMRLGMRMMMVITLIWGVALLAYSMGIEHPAFYPFLILGIIAMAAAVNYTSGSKPYGYQGLGDLSVVIFFGLVAVLGSYYLQTLRYEWINLLPALSCGCFATAVLNVNNIRDIQSDRQAGKRSVPVRIGRQAATYYHWILLATGLVCSALFVGIDYRSPWQWLFLLIIPLLYVNGRAITIKQGHDLDPYLKQLAFTTLFYVLSFGLGLVLSA